MSIFVVSAWRGTHSTLQTNIICHEQKNKKTTCQIKLWTVKIKQRVELVLQHSLCKWTWCIGSSVAIAQSHLKYFLSSQRTHNNILLHLLARISRTCVCFLCSNDKHMKPRFTKSVGINYIVSMCTKFCLKLWFESNWYYCNITESRWF